MFSPVAVNIALIAEAVELLGLQYLIQYERATYRHYAEW